jgi:hypothetical protein
VIRVPWRWSRIERAAHAAGASIEDVGVDHRRADVLVAHEFLDRADVVAALQEVRRERMAQGVGVAILAIPAARTAARTARWMTVSCRWCRRLWPISRST